jgi:hypothetical protein
MQRFEIRSQQAVISWLCSVLRGIIRVSTQRPGASAVADANSMLTSEVQLARSDVPLSNTLCSNEVGCASYT